jgi:hypothetical protein
MVKGKENTWRKVKGRRLGKRERGLRVGKRQRARKLILLICLLQLCQPVNHTSNNKTPLLAG